MCRNGAECTTTEASAVHVDGMPDHLIGGNPFPVVAGMWHSGVGQVERLVHFRLCHWRIHGFALYRHITCGLPNGVAVPTVGLDFDMLEVFGLMFFALQTLLERMQHNVCLGLFRNVAVFLQNDSLANVVNVVDVASVLQSFAQFDNGTFTHAVYEHVGSAFRKN